MKNIDENEIQSQEHWSAEKTQPWQNLHILLNSQIQFWKQVELGLEEKQRNMHHTFLEKTQKTYN